MDGLGGLLSNFWLIYAHALWHSLLHILLLLRENGSARECNDTQHHYYLIRHLVSSKTTTGMQDAI